MEPIAWSDKLLLDFEPMDSVHRDFVVVLAAAQSADDAHLERAWMEVIDHTRSHFEREDQWMRGSGFASADSHILQHRVVLNVLREGLALARNGQFGGVREMATELAAWFDKHAQTQDAALALHMRRQAEMPAPARRHMGDAGQRQGRRA
ncbi:MAG: hemerythrin domain-containing protein [Gammaproteobacteria bacterium]